ncbi:acyl-CoA thioesterase II [soil metagenome]
MNPILQEFVDLLALEQLEVNLFRGQNRHLGWPRVYGGQVLAQGLVAAGRTVPEDRTVHSMHAYFILPGDIEVPLIYDVDRIRDGGSFTTRRVRAIQHGRPIFNMSASFHKHEEGIEHQSDMPDVPPPEGLKDDLDLLRAKAERLPERLRPFYLQDRPIEFRPVNPVDPFDPKPRTSTVKHMWMRTVDTLPETPLIHQAMVAYASDYGLLAAALLPHGMTFFQHEMMAASLDHAIWFHRPFRADEWLLYSMDSPSAAGARGFTRGSLFTREGALVASVAQEGLIRMTPSEKGGRWPAETAGSDSSE